MSMKGDNISRALVPIFCRVDKHHEMDNHCPVIGQFTRLADLGPELCTASKIQSLGSHVYHCLFWEETCLVIHLFPLTYGLASHAFIDDANAVFHDQQNLAAQAQMLFYFVYPSVLQFIPRGGY